MTSTLRVSDFKSGGATNKRKIPSEGTILRRYYDMARECEWFRPEDVQHNTMESLSLFYGQEFETRKVKIKGTPEKRGSTFKEFRLTGEWEGPYFRTRDEILMEQNRYE